MKKPIPFIILLLSGSVLVGSAKAQEKRSYVVMESYDTLLHLLKAGDRFDISAKEGLYHYRDGKLLDRYKIIGKPMTMLRTAPCQKPPCPQFTHNIFVYYSELWQRYIAVSDLSSKSWFNISKIKYAEADPVQFKEGDWLPIYRLKKLSP